MASWYSKLCSSLTPRRKAPCAAALPLLGKLISPSLSPAAIAISGLSGTCAATIAETRIDPQASQVQRIGAPSYREAHLIRLTEFAAILGRSSGGLLVSQHPIKCGSRMDCCGVVDRQHVCANVDRHHQLCAAEDHRVHLLLGK